MQIRIDGILRSTARSLENMNTVGFVFITMNICHNLMFQNVYASFLMNALTINVVIPTDGASCAVASNCVEPLSLYQTRQ